MAIEKISVDQFLLLSKDHPVLDVRSPSEFSHAHIPLASNLPLFDDEERKVVGTIYKQQSRQQAIKAGMDFFGIKMREMVEKTEEIISQFYSQFEVSQQPEARKTVLVHCWRGGMRSMALAWLLDVYGFKVYTLTGGYKAYRNAVLQKLEQPFHCKILGGYTGSGKTEVLGELERYGELEINLEKLACHKGSAFGAFGEKPQPSQEMFENLLSRELLFKTSVNLEGGAIWIEDESQRIGALHIPKSFWETMRSSPVYFLDIPFEERLSYLIANYGSFPGEDLANAIIRIAKRLGGLETKNALSFLQESNIKECFRILLKYYDKYYTKGLYNRQHLTKPYTIPCEKVSTGNVTRLVSLVNEQRAFMPSLSS